jgi:hypothetical protein
MIFLKIFSGIWLIRKNHNGEKWNPTTVTGFQQTKFQSKCHNPASMIEIWQVWPDSSQFGKNLVRWNPASATGSWQSDTKI